MRRILLILFLFLAAGPWSSVLGPRSLIAKTPDPNYPLANALLTTRTIAYIQRYYADPARIDTQAMFEAALNQVQKNVPEVLARCEKPDFCSVTVNQATKRFKYPAKELACLQSSLKGVLEFIAQHVDKDTDKDEVEASAIEGMLNELDPHSNFFSADVYREFRVGTEGEFGGLGIVIGLKDGKLTVTAPLEGTPAWRAGVKAGDSIVQINDESTINMTLTEAVERLRGPVGTKVTLKIERSKRNTPITMTLKRAMINIEAVQSKLAKTPKGNNVGFLRVKSFQSNTGEDFIKQLMNLADNQKLKGVILDLRNNPGGLLDQAIILSDAFLDEGVIVSTVGPQGKLIDRQRARADGYEKELPVIVLVNEGSASASEIVAGALKNNDRALILGTKTFGKGSVQSVYELPLDAAIKLTVAQYLTPGNQSIQSIGITPDVELDPVIIDKDHLDMIENIRFGEKDLEKHFDKQTEEIEKPELVLHFLAPTPKDEEEPQYRTGLVLEDDTVAQVALSLIDSITSASRPEMLHEIEPAIKTRQIEEDKKAAGALQKLGIRWANGEKPKEGSPRAELSFNLFKDGKPVKKAVAGETVTLKISVKNVGKAPFYKLSAQSESEEGLLKNIEFAFGNIEPEAAQSWETKLKIPLASLTEEVPFQLKFKEGHGNPPADAEIIIPIQGLKRPRFAYLYSLEEQWAAKLKSGKAIDMKITVSNQGEGPSKTAIVALKNLNGKEVFIEKGRVVMDPLEPGKSAATLLRFHTNPEWQKEIRLELNITDTDLLVNTKQEITLNLEEEKTVPAQAVLYSPPAITLASKASGPAKNPFLLEGEAKDDKIIKDFFIFLDDKKVFYESNAKQGEALPFQVNLDLKEGNNTVVMTARDNMNLVTRQFFVLQYASPPKEEKKK